MNDATSQDILNRARRVRLLILDVDGVLTDGLLYRGPDGAEFKAFNTRDGHGIRRLLAEGWQVAVISGRAGSATAERLTELGIEIIHLGVADKLAALEQVLRETDVVADEAAYVGDDLPDLPAMQAVGFAIAVADAEPAVRQAAHWATPRSGGRGAVRDVADLLLASSSDHHQPAASNHLNQTAKRTTRSDRGQ